MITYRKPNETMRDYFKREYALCIERVDKYYVLQSLRRDQGYYGAALFYQNEAARWHDRAMESRHQWLISSWYKPELRILNFLIEPDPDYIVGEHSGTDYCNDVATINQPRGVPYTPNKYGF